MLKSIETGIAIKWFIIGVVVASVIFVIGIQRAQIRRAEQAYENLNQMQDAIALIAGEFKKYPSAR